MESQARLNISSNSSDVDFNKDFNDRDNAFGLGSDFDPHTPTMRCNKKRMTETSVFSKSNFSKKTAFRDMLANKPF
jgi:hypothetical protein